MRHSSCEMLGSEGGGRGLGEVSAGRVALISSRSMPSMLAPSVSSLQPQKLSLSTLWMRCRLAVPARARLKLSHWDTFENRMDLIVSTLVVAQESVQVIPLAAFFACAAVRALIIAVARLLSL